MLLTRLLVSFISSLKYAESPYSLKASIVKSLELGS